MIMDDLAKRLDSAAGELSRQRAELADRGFVFDRAGKGADELAAVLESVWAEHQGSSGRLADGLLGLSTAVGAAADGYRTTDEEAF